MLRLITRGLSGCPYEILTAKSAGEALAMLERRPIDVLVCDVEMPDLSGVELAQIARRDHPNTVRMLLTGCATLETALRAINSGEVLRFLTKPFEPAVFLDEMARLTDRVEALHSQQVAEAQKARMGELYGWLDSRFPGCREIIRNDAGEIEVDLVDLLAEVEAGALPISAKDLLRRDG